MMPKWWNEPTPLVGIRRLDSAWDVQLLGVRIVNEIVNSDHGDDGNWHSKVTQSSSYLIEDGNL